MTVGLEEKKMDKGKRKSYTSHFTTMYTQPVNNVQNEMIQ